ncbi:MAG: hypothetical protein PVF45_12480 [Anaerolineae bacterium]
MAQPADGEQPAQPPPLLPATARPSLCAAKREMARKVRVPWQFLHTGGSFALLLGRNISNFVLQSLHWYS